MRLSQLIVKRRLTRFKSVIPLLLPLYMDAHIWNEDEYIGEIYARKRDYIVDKILVFYTKKKKIECNPRYKDVLDYKGEPIIELDLERSDVNLVELIRSMVNDQIDSLIFPDELLIAAGIEPPKRNTSDFSWLGGGTLLQEDAYYEDVISDETILKLKELPLPKLKQQVAMLAAEKKQLDAAVMSAAKIGLLFCEEGLQKPATLKKFVAEYKKQLDKFPVLHDTTLKRIYKNLPDGYRFTREGGQAHCEQTDMRPVIKAAALAGSMAHAKDSMNIGSLKKSLSIEQYIIPSDDILEEIIAAVKKLEIEEDD